MPKRYYSAQRLDYLREANRRSREKIKQDLARRERDRLAAERSKPAAQPQQDQPQQ